MNRRTPKNCYFNLKIFFFYQNAQMAGGSSAIDLGPSDASRQAWILRNPDALCAYLRMQERNTTEKGCVR
jgi:hypothetical protein